MDIITSKEMIGMENLSKESCSQVLELTEKIKSLRYLNDEKYWIHIRLGEIDKKILDSICKCYKEKKDATIVFPYLCPKNIILSVIELIYQSFKSKPQSIIAFISPSSRLGWGNLTDILEEYNKYGLSNALGDVPEDCAGKLSENFPARKLGKDGKILGTNVTKCRDKFYILKNIKEINYLENLECIIINFLSKFDYNLFEDIINIKNRYNNLLIYLFFSLYTYWPRTEYEPSRVGPPNMIYLKPKIPKYLDFKESNNVSINIDDLSSSIPYKESLYQYHMLFHQKNLIVKTIEDQQLSMYFSRLFKYMKELKEIKAEQQRKKILGATIFFQKIAVPLRYWNQWIEDSSSSKNYRYRPHSTSEKLDDITEFIEPFEIPIFPSIMADITQTLENIINRLYEQNPLYEEIKRMLDLSIEYERKIALNFPAKSQMESFLYCLNKDIGIDRNYLLENNIFLYYNKILRNLNSTDILLFLGRLHPQNSAYYLHPCAKTIWIYLYNDLIRYIESDISTFVKKINDFYSLNKCELSVIEPKIKQLSVHKRRNSNNIEIDDYYEEDSEEKLLKTFFRSLYSDENIERFHKYSKKNKKIIIITSSNNTIDISGGLLIKIREHDVLSGGRYILIDLEDLKIGDQVIHIPFEIKKKIYWEELKKEYEKEIGRSRFEPLFELLKIWHDTIREIYYLDENFSIIYEQLKNKGCKRNYNTVRSWFKSVISISDPIELIENEFGTIGPRRSEDIILIGKTFKKQILIEKHKEIEAAMESFRTLNRIMGKKIKDVLIKRIKNKDDEIRKKSEKFIIKEIKIKDEEIGL